MFTWQFVDSIASSPTVRLDLNTMTSGIFVTDQPELSPPELRRVVSSSMLADGEKIPAAAFANRVLTLPLYLQRTTADLQASLLQSLARELSRQPGNILRLGIATNPMFFRTFPAPDAAYDVLMHHPAEGKVTIQVPCEPFGYGLEEVLSPVTVYNDPADGDTLNSNPFFESTATPWAATGGTAVRSTAQFHFGVASLLLTPSGAAATSEALSENVTGASPGVLYRASAWVRCAVSRNVNININWRQAGGSLISNTQATFAVVANTWTQIGVSNTSPALTGQIQLTVNMTGTPPAGNTLFIDEARIRVSGGSGGMCFDIASPKGDVETPLYLVVDNGVVRTGRVRSGFAVRRRGTVSNVPFLLQAENMTFGLDTTSVANSTAMSGAPSGNNFTRTTFATLATMQPRLSAPARFPSASSVDARGTYRVFVRVRQNTAADVFDMRLSWGGVTVQVVNDTVRLPPDTGPGAPTIKYIDLGQVKIPLGYDPVSRGLSNVEIPAEGLYLSVAAQRVSGAGTLDIDCLLFLPADDRQEFIKWPENMDGLTDFVAVGGSTPSAYARNAAGDVSSIQAIEISGSGMMITPGRTNRVYFGFDLGIGTALTGAGDDIQEITVLTPSYYPRYLFPLKPVST